MNQEYTNLLLLHSCNVLFKLIDKRSHVQLIYHVIDELPAIDRSGLSPHDQIEKIKSIATKKVDSSYTGIDNMIETTKKSLERHNATDDNGQRGDSFNEQRVLLAEARGVLKRVVKYSDVPHLIDHVLQCITVEEFRTEGLCCATQRRLKGLAQEMYAKFLDKMWDLRQRIEGVLSSEHARDVFMAELDAKCRPEKEEPRAETKSQDQLGRANELLWRSLNVLTLVLQMTPDAHMQSVIYKAQGMITGRTLACGFTTNELIEQLKTGNHQHAGVYQLDELDRVIECISADIYDVCCKSKSAVPDDLRDLLLDVKYVLCSIDCTATIEKIDEVLDRARTVHWMGNKDMFLFVISRLHDMICSNNRFNMVQLRDVYGRVIAELKAAD
jgi:hypothetical protein